MRYSNGYLDNGLGKLDPRGTNKRNVPDMRCLKGYYVEHTPVYDSFYRIVGYNSECVPIGRAQQGTQPAPSRTGMGGLGYTDKEMADKARADRDYCWYKTGCVKPYCVAVHYLRSDWMTEIQPMCSCGRCDRFDGDVRVCPKGYTSSCTVMNGSKVCFCRRTNAIQQTTKQSSSMFRM